MSSSLARRSFASRAGQFYRLTKPRVVSLIVFTAIIGMFLATPGMVPLEGGLPLIAGGRIVGAIGVSGMRSNQDGQVADAGAKAL